MRIKELAELASNLQSKKSPLNSLFQEVAENFYPERADFTVNRPLGTDFAANLMTSYPVLCRRDLGNQLGTMLRPTARPWFHVIEKYADKDVQDNDVRATLEYFETVMRRAMYDRSSMFTRATKEADHDFSAFGQCVLSVDVNKNADGLIYRSWHIRDMAWQENEEGQIGFVCRNWKPTVQSAERTFPGKNHEKVTKLLDKTPFEPVDYLHIVCDADMYDDNAKGRPRWSIWWDKQNQHLVEAVPIWGKYYVIPRWQTVSSSQYGSQYSYSPAVVAALPDARLIQAMTFTLLEVGEKAANPPLVATADAVRSDISVFAGGITWVDKEYDERLGDALRPISQDFRGLNYGLELTQSTREMIHKAFFLDALTMPQRAPEMTAYEVGQRVQEYIRNALPIFEPMEMEYNAALCEETFDVMMKHNAFGSPLDWPQKMRGMDLDFKFESPLHDAIEQQKGQKWIEAKSLLADSIALDPGTRFILDAKKALRDVLSGVGVPAKWLNNDEMATQLEQDEKNQVQQQQTLAALSQGSQAAANFASAQRDISRSEGAAISR